MLIECGLQFHVEFLALPEQLVQLDFAQNAAQSGLRELRGRVKIIRHLDHRLGRLDDAEIDHGIHLHGDVVARDDVLRGYFHRLHA